MPGLVSSEMGFVCVLTPAWLKYLCVGCNVEAGKHLVGWKPRQCRKSSCHILRNILTFPLYILARTLISLRYVT